MKKKSPDFDQDACLCTCPAILMQRFCFFTLAKCPSNPSLKSLSSFFKDVLEIPTLATWSLYICSVQLKARAGSLFSRSEANILSLFSQMK